MEVLVRRRIVVMVTLIRIRTHACEHGDRSAILSLKD